MIKIILQIGSIYFIYPNCGVSSSQINWRASLQKLLPPAMAYGGTSQFYNFLLQYILLNISKNISTSHIPIPIFEALIKWSISSFTLHLVLHVRSSGLEGWNAAPCRIVALCAETPLSNRHRSIHLAFAGYSTVFSQTAIILQCLTFRSRPIKVFLLIWHI